jgi:DUF1365 family protein
MTGPTEAVMLHTGAVSHTRHVAPRRRFAYRFWMVSADLDAVQATRLFRRNSAGLVSLHDADHGKRDGTALRPWVEGQLARAGLADAASRIRLLAIPRVLGHAFNPISFYFCYRNDGSLGAVIHEVKNTFGGQVAYCLPAEGERIRQGCGKRLHVSPFFDMRGGYRFAFRPPRFEPGAEWSIGIVHAGPEGQRMTAAMRLTAEPYSEAAMARLALGSALLPARVLGAIHWQALLLWLRGARFHPLGAAPADPIGSGT